MASSTPLFTKFEQIAFVVPDLTAAAELFCTKYGIGPWEIMRFGDSGDGNKNTVSIDNVFLRGRETGTYSILQAHCLLPQSGVEIELIQPLTGESIFAEYLDKYGAGVQHLSIKHGDFDESIARIERGGHGVSQIAAVDTVETCVFSDHRDIIGTDLELHKRPADFAPPELEQEFYPADGKMPTGSPETLPEVARMTVSCREPKKTAAWLESTYGIGPWASDGTHYICDELNVQLCLAQADCDARVTSLSLFPKERSAQENILGVTIL
jgi:hypothetical protein